MDIYRYSRSEKPVDLLGMNACVLQIFHILLSESMATPACTTPPRSKLEDSISFTEYLAAHYKEHITLESVSEHFGFNPTYFSRMFAKKTGRNFNVYLSSLRLDHATHLLETTTSSIPDISEESGFSSSRAFIEMFKKVNELTPKQYRDQCNEHKKCITPMTDFFLLTCRHSKKENSPGLIHSFLPDPERLSENGQALSSDAPQMHVMFRNNTERPPPQYCLYLTHLTMYMHSFVLFHPNFNIRNIKLCIG